jgi:NTP pyrophosphatase (non-canonical NTP hydrolase)
MSEDCKPVTGSGDFSIGSAVWPGTSKVIEETGELLQVLGKLIAVGGATEHWDGDLRKKLVEEASDVAAAVCFFVLANFTDDELHAYNDRMDVKFARFRAWHANPTKPGAPTESPAKSMVGHVLFEGQALCGFMAGQLPKDWPSGHYWVSIMDVVWTDGKPSIPKHKLFEPCDRCIDRIKASAKWQR